MWADDDEVEAELEDLCSGVNAHEAKELTQEGQPLWEDEADLSSPFVVPSPAGGSHFAADADVLQHLQDRHADKVMTKDAPAKL